MNSLKLFSRLLWIGAVLGCASSLTAQTFSDPVTVPVQIIGAPELMGMNPANGSSVNSFASISLATSSDSLSTSTPNNLRNLSISPSLRPGKAYYLSMSAVQVAYSFKVYINPPSGYKVYINDVEQSGLSYTANVPTNFMVASVPAVVKIRVDDGQAQEAGQSDALRPAVAGRGGVLWSIGLGFLKNGASAGLLSLRETTVGGATYFGNMYCTSGSSEVQQITDNSGCLRQVYANQCLVNLDPLPAGSGYTVKYFSRGDVSTAQTPLNAPTDNTLVWAVNTGAQPLIEYTVESPAEDRIRITKLSRINSPGRTTVNTWQTEMYRETTGTDNWIVVGWTQNNVSGTATLPVGDNWQRWVYTVPGSIGGQPVRITERIESFDALGASAGAVLNTYNIIGGALSHGFELVSKKEGDGSANPLITTYEYHTDTTQPGNY